MNQIKAVMLGHAVGDALGVPVEFNNRESLKNNPVTSMRGFGTYHVPSGTWSDDTSMSLCALDVLSKGTVNYQSIMKNFCSWYYHDKFTATNVLFDVGNACADAIETYFNLRHSATKCGSNSEWSNGNGSLMRIHPFVLYAYYNNIDDDTLVDMIASASSLTHAHQCSIDGCTIYAYVLKEILNNQSKQSVYNGLNKVKNQVKTKNKYYNRLLNQDIVSVDEREIKSSGYVVDSLEAAIWCLLTTDNYHDCVLKAVNLGEDTDTVAAIAGGLAGALYGIESIPKDWLETLKKKDMIENMCETAYYNWR